MTGPRPASLRIDRSYTVSAWVLHDAFGDTAGTVVGMADSSFGLGYRPDTRKWGFQLADGPAVGSDFGAESDRWVHLVATFDATTGTAVLYVNGIKQTSTQTGLQVPNGAGDLVTGRGVTGAVDDVRVYSGAMVEQDVLALRGASMH